MHLRQTYPKDRLILGRVVPRFGLIDTRKLKDDQPLRTPVPLKGFERVAAHQELTSKLSIRVSNQPLVLAMSFRVVDLDLND